MTFLVQRSDVGEFRRRYRWMVLFILATFGVLVGRLVQLQIVEGEMHRAEARSNIIRPTTLATSRGVIRDAHGRVLAANRPSYNVYVVPEIIDMKVTWPRVTRLMGLDQAEAQALEQRILKLAADPRKKQQQTLLKVDVSRDVVAALKTHEARRRRRGDQDDALHGVRWRRPRSAITHSGSSART